MSDRSERERAIAEYLALVEAKKAGKTKKAGTPVPAEEIESPVARSARPQWHEPSWSVQWDGYGTGPARNPAIVQFEREFGCCTDLKRRDFPPGLEGDKKWAKWNGR